jgi:hypothetical protein
MENGVSRVERRYQPFLPYYSGMYRGRVGMKGKKGGIMKPANKSLMTPECCVTAFFNDEWGCVEGGVCKMVPVN